MYENFSEVIEEVVGLLKGISEDHEVDEYSHQCFLGCRACRADFSITVLMQWLEDLEELLEEIVNE